MTIKEQITQKPEYGDECIECGKNVKDYSIRYYGQVLCRECQPEYQKKKQEKVRTEKMKLVCKNEHSDEIYWGKVNISPVCLFKSTFSEYSSCPQNYDTCDYCVMVEVEG